MAAIILFQQKQMEAGDRIFFHLMVPVLIAAALYMREYKY